MLDVFILALLGERWQEDGQQHLWHANDVQHLGLD
jgi:hypothetical protein